MSIREPKARKAYCLYRDSPGVGPVVAVQITFGRAFRRTHRLCSEGEILAVTFRVTNGGSIAITSEGTSPLNCKIVRKVHPNTIYAELRRVGRRGVVLDAGHWYEVHAD